MWAEIPYGYSGEKLYVIFEYRMCYLYVLLALTLLSAVSLIYHGWRNGITPMPSSLKATETMAMAAAEEAARLAMDGSSEADSKAVAEKAARLFADGRSHPGAEAAARPAGEPDSRAAARTASEDRELLIIEAGSGWGGLATALARRVPGARIMGYENSPLPFLFSLLRARIAGCRRVEFHFQDYRQADLSSADIIVTYLFPRGMRDIARLLDSGEGRGDKNRKTPVLISNTFALPGRQADRKIQSGDAALSPVYIYRLGVLESP